MEDTSLGRGKNPLIKIILLQIKINAPHVNSPDWLLKFPLNYGLWGNKIRSKWQQLEVINETSQYIKHLILLNFFCHLMYTQHFKALLRKTVWLNLNSDRHSKWFGLFSIYRQSKSFGFSYTNIYKVQFLFLLFSVPFIVLWLQIHEIIMIIMIKYTASVHL